MEHAPADGDHDPDGDHDLDRIPRQAADQDALASAEDRLGRLLSTAGDCWEQGVDVPPTVWRRIAEVAAEVSAYATALARAQPRLETH